MTVHPSPKYLVYTLRCWEERGEPREENPQVPGEWRFMLVDVQTGQRHGFGVLKQVAEFLEEKLEQESQEKAL
ncbi:MAG: hypothetical protein HUU38_31380 [Anaerolineales bacterium]|nr:hypothetical protein [Anaerolineales bacterium]